MLNDQGQTSCSWLTMRVRIPLETRRKQRSLKPCFKVEHHFSLAKYIYIYEYKHTARENLNTKGERLENYESQSCSFPVSAKISCFVDSIIKDRQTRVWSLILYVGFQQLMKMDVWKNLLFKFETWYILRVIFDNEICNER